MASSLAPKIQAWKVDAAIAKGKAVKIGSDDKHVAVGAANTDACIGIIQNAPDTAEDTAEVAVSGGGGKGLLGESVAAGQPLCSDTDGSLVKPNALGDYVIAHAMQAGVSGDLIDVNIGRSQAPAAV